MVHLRVRRGVRAGFDLRVSSRRMAVWTRGSGLVRGSSQPLAAGEIGKVKVRTR